MKFGLILDSIPAIILLQEIIKVFKDREYVMKILGNTADFRNFQFIVSYKI